MAIGDYVQNWIPGSARLAFESTAPISLSIAIAIGAYCDLHRRSTFGE